MDSNKCLQCGQEHERKGVYCSKKCTDKAYRDRKAGKANALPIIKQTTKEETLQVPNVEVPPEKGEKLKWCNFCGTQLNENTLLQFCNDEHKYGYYKTISIGGTLKLHLDSRTTIETKKYERVQQLIEAMTTRNTFLTF